MTTGTPGSTARKNALQLVHYLRFTVNYNDVNVAGGNTKQWLPAGAIIVGTDVQIVTAFNAGTTNTLSVGTVGDTGTDIVNAQSVAATGLTQNVAPTGAALGPLAADKQVVTSYAQTGTAATAGQAVVIVKYIPNNDL